MIKKKQVTEKIKFPCFIINQNNKYILVCFVAKATSIWDLVQINKCDPDKETGYQRALSLSRVNSISKYIEGDNPLPLSILVSFDKAELIDNDKFVSIENKKDSGWVIDGQHRLVGSHRANKDIELLVSAFIKLPLSKQIEQFVTINKEAKGVPTSLYYDLLKRLPHKKADSEIAKEKAVEIANQLRKDTESPFFGKIVIVTSPRRGELSLTNFVRKIAPLVHPKTGKLNLYPVTTQIKIIFNYYKAFEHVFPKLYEPINSIYFQTLGFGALFNAFPTVLDLSLKFYNGFTLKDVIATLKKIDYFDFSDWSKAGSGNQAETQAGADLRAELLARFNDVESGGIRV